MRVTTEIKVIAGFSLGLLLMVGLGVATFRTTKGLLDENQKVTHTFEVIVSLDNVIASMTDAQTGQRGYVITGDERFLEPYNAALPRLSDGIERVRQLTVDNPNQQKQISELQRRVKRNLAVINEVITLRRRGDAEAAAEVVKSGRGKVGMDAIRQLIREMKDEEDRLLSARTEKAKTSARRVVVAFFALTVAVFLLLSFSYLLVRRDVARRKMRESALREMSLTDELTGLHNRRGFLTLAAQQVRIARRTKMGLLLVFADMDGLKLINDEYGHEEGSRAIVTAGKLLRKAFRESDVIARLGGDEFAVLVVGSDDVDGEFFTSRLREITNLHNERADAPFVISMSVGVVRLSDVLSIEEAMSKADELMYEDKRRRRAEQSFPPRISLKGEC
jgi:diguanylate cyclase (GGDEF)-like protein